MKCGDEDKEEICIGGCECLCHLEFWASYEEAMKKISETDNQDNSSGEDF